MTNNLPVDKMLILRIALAVPIDSLFDYLPPQNTTKVSELKIGSRVRVSFGSREKTGILVEITDTTTFKIEKLKNIKEILDETPLLGKLDIELLQWASDYYHYPVGEVLMSAFPILLRKGRPAKLDRELFYQLTETGKTIDQKNTGRAKKQLALINLFKNSSFPLTTTQISFQIDNWHSPFKKILEKQWITEAEPIKITPSAPKQILSSSAFKANTEQQNAIDCVCESLDQFKAFLLEGVTGSGKTEVYMQIIQQVLISGKQVLVLLPEITLTPQLEARFRKRFAVPVAIYHSKLSNTQRLESWLKMQQGEAAILLGTRSALFTPMLRPGLIILDEEHDSSFKQQEGFRFSARDVSVVRAKTLNIPVVLGTATPSLESFNNSVRGRYQHLRLSERAGKATQPVIQLLDIRNKKMQEGFSEPLLAQISQTLEKDEQVLIFLNRRGYAPVLMCHSCGWIARCHRCDANLVVHFNEKKLRCHHCGQEQILSRQCRSCQSEELRPIGLGTERIEQALQVFFPNSRAIRLDRDTTQRKNQLEQQLQAINSGQAEIILGTQMLAKGHHFPNVTLVAMLDVDSGLFGIDYHAPEKLAQMIVQVSGRAGRAEKPGKVVLQTRKPDHPLLLTLINQGYSHFARSALAERQAAQLPPFSYQALFRVLAMDKQAPLSFLQEIADFLKSGSHKALVLGPVPAPMEKRAGRYHYQLLVQARHRSGLHDLLDLLMPKIETMKLAKKVRWSLDVDPVDLY